MPRPPRRLRRLRRRPPLATRFVVRLARRAGPASGGWRAGPWGLIAAIVVVLALLVSSPGPAQYRGWLGAQVAPSISVKASMGAIVEDLAAAEAAAPPFTVTRNLGLCRVYTTTVSGWSLTTVGILGHFIPLRQAGAPSTAGMASALIQGGAAGR